MSNEFLTVSETYQWDEATDEFIHMPTNKRYPASAYDIKVKVFESRVREWFLDVAQGIVSKGQSPGDYVALSIAIAHLEGVQQYREGQKTPARQAGMWFKGSAKRVFPSVSADVLDRLWKEARCGLFHSGFTDGYTYLSHANPNALEIDGRQLKINPKMFVEAAINDFDIYIRELLNDPNSQLGRNFEQLWDCCWENS